MKDINCLVLLKSTIDAWEINAKREKESGNRAEHWEAQQIAFQRVQELLKKAGVEL